MKRKLLFSCEKEGQIFCSAICWHLPPLTRHTENWFCFKVAAPSAACQSVADMRDLWMKPESMRSVCCTVASACLWTLGTLENIKWKHHNRSSGICADLNKRKIRGKKEKNIYLQLLHVVVLLQHSTYGNKHVFAIKWPSFVEHERNARIWIYHTATREPYVSSDFRRPFWTHGDVDQAIVWYAQAARHKWWPESTY